MKELLDYKSHFGEIKDLDKKNRIVTGYLSSWDLDHHNDIIQQGAFSKTIKERGEQILFLNQHNWHQPHGLGFKELEEDSFGLRFVSKPLPNTTYSNDALELYAAGIVKEHSIGFQSVKWDWDDDSEIRTIKEIKLFEGSNVTLGANSNTPFTGFKSMTIEDINDMSDRIMKFIRSGKALDETFIQLELALKQLQTESYKRGKLDALNQPSEEDTDPSPSEYASLILDFTKTIR